ncbi:MAG: translocation/assembly module TamB domain-containing protein [Bacteroidaceae bacterium]|nr:translocation/assembly module TamB domain-containing protein [Bacteroidaceae bacterium]
MVLLYVPPVQNFVCDKAASVASESLGMDITIGRVDLRFPLNLLVHDLKAVQQGDTLLDVGTLDVRVKAWPLLKGKVDVQKAELSDASLNSANLIEGILVKGHVGNLALESHHVDLNTQEAYIDDFSLSDSQVYVAYSDTVPNDTLSEPVNWVIRVEKLALNQVGVDFEMPLDTFQLSTYVNEAQLKDGLVDLKDARYEVANFTFDGRKLTLDMGEDKRQDKTDGIDPSHLALYQIRMEVDSILYQDPDIKAVIQEMSLFERSGFEVSSLTGHFLANSDGMHIDDMRILTPHSEVSLQSEVPMVNGQWSKVNPFMARLNARLGKEDLMALVGKDKLDEAFRRQYPIHPLVLRTQVNGTLNRLEITQLRADLPGAFSLNSHGNLYNITDSLKRSGQLAVQAQTGNLGFLLGLAGIKPGDKSIAIPDSMRLAGNLQLDGQQIGTSMTLAEGKGNALVNGTYHLQSEAYEADVRVDSIRIDHFLPQDSIYLFTGHLVAKGKGLDFSSPKSTSQFETSVDQVQFKEMDIRQITADGSLQNSRISLNLTADNQLFRLSGQGRMRTDVPHFNGNVDLQVEDIDLYKLGLASKPLDRPFALHITGIARRDSAQFDIKGGDLDLRLKSLTTIDKLLADGQRFDELLRKQIETRQLNHAELRAALPAGGLRIRAGRDNPLADYLKTEGITFNDIQVNYGFTPEMGINGRAALHGLRVDSLQLDTIYFTLRQDTSHLAFQGGVINGPRNPQYVFHVFLDGDIRSKDVDMNINYIDGRGNTGLKLGFNAQPVVNGGRNGGANGLLIYLTPEEPIVAYRQFHFNEDYNWLYLHQDKRLYAHIDMRGDEGLRFRMRSDRSDTISLQNMTVELSRLQLKDLSAILPYIPEVGGLISVDATYLQTATSMQVSAESMIDSLTYEHKPVGDVNLGLTWLPEGTNKHYLDSYLMLDNEQVVMASGTIKGDSLNIDADVEDFPLRVADVFIPDGIVNFLGKLQGNLQVRGITDKPRVNGEVQMDGVSIVAQQAGARYRLDDRPIIITANQMVLNDFSIYTTSDNPFVVKGVVDFRDVSNPSAVLSLRANRYTLLDAPRTRESLLFGKILVDMNATIRGPLSGLVMRGQMNVLGDTNATYVMANSPLTVEDRLDGLVTFVSFNDTLYNGRKDQNAMSLGGLDMNMTVHIDDAVRLRANLTTDGSKYVELQGGGDLNMLYTPQGDMNLTGRYTLSGGTMKYSLPVIPLKEFTFMQGSYVDWRGDIMNPRLSLTATERVRASVSDGENSSRRTDFDVSVSIKNTLEAPDLSFDLSAPSDGTIQNELQSMSTDERSKAAITMLATGMYMGNSGAANGLTMGAALNSVLQSQINTLAGSVSNASFSVGIEDREMSTGTQTDYTFRYSQRFFNDRVQINIGGKISTGNNATNDMDSFIDNVSLEYRLDSGGTRYIRAFHNKNYENLIEGEITETGVGFLFRKKLDSLSDLWMWARKKGQ